MTQKGNRSVFWLAMRRQHRRGALPAGTIQWRLDTRPGLLVSVREPAEILHAVRQPAASLVGALKAEDRASPVVLEFARCLPTRPAGQKDSVAGAIQRRG